MPVSTLTNIRISNPELIKDPHHFLEKEVLQSFFQRSPFVLREAFIKNSISNECFCSIQCAMFENYYEVRNRVYVPQAFNVLFN